MKRKSGIHSGAQALRIALAAGLVTLALLKLLGGYSGMPGGPAVLFYGPAIVEACIAWLLVAGRLRIAAVSLVVACGIGLVFSFLDPDADCGCLGQYVKADVLVRRMLLALGGMGGGALVLLERR